MLVSQVTITRKSVSEVEMETHIECSSGCSNWSVLVSVSGMHVVE